MSAAVPAALREVVEAFDSPAEIWRDLAAFGDHLREANARMNLVGAASLADFWGRHVLDSGQLLRFAPDARRWVDIGSGAGFPGLVLAILLKRTVGARIDLVESRGKRCAFLAATAAQLDLPVRTWNARAETLAFAADVVTARACAPLARLVSYAEGFFRMGARGIFLKGEGWRSEIEAARKAWRFELTTHPSLSDPRGRILCLEDVRRAP